jgi:hypothetical protein
MPAELIAHVSGHELVQVGSLYNYIDANRTIATAGGPRSLPVPLPLTPTPTPTLLLQAAKCWLAGPPSRGAS